MTQHGKAAGLHAPGILAEELIVERSRDRAPQRPVMLRGDARLGHLQQTRGEPDVRQQLIGIQVAPTDALQRCRDEANGDGSGFHVGISHPPSLRDSVNCRIGYGLNFGFLPDGALQIHEAHYDQQTSD